MGFRNVAPGEQSIAGVEDSLRAGGRVVAPGAGVAVATTPVGVAGAIYDLTVACSIGTGGVALDAGNMELREGANVLAVLGVPSLGSIDIPLIRRTNVGGTAYSVNATGAATATVPYTATIIATRIS